MRQFVVRKMSYVNTQALQAEHLNDFGHSERPVWMQEEIIFSKNGTQSGNLDAEPFWAKNSI